MYSQLLMIACLQNVDIFEGNEALLILSPSAILTSSEPAVQNILLARAQIFSLSDWKTNIRVQSDLRFDKAVGN